MSDITNEVDQLLESLPSTSENQLKAKALVRFLTTDEQGITHIEDIREGIFERIIPDSVLARKATNLFHFVKQENNLSVTSDLVHLYFWVLNVIKLTLSSREILKLLKGGILSENTDRKTFFQFSLLAKLDSNFHNLNMQYQRELAISRDKRMVKEIKSTDEFGNSWSHVLSQIPAEQKSEEKDENRKDEIRKEEDDYNL